MKEQLFIIKDGERFELDLNNPSGISLNYKSDLFGNLSNFTCSHSYTFKLPMTLNNRLILDSAEEIRCDSGMIRKRLKAEFYQNGINILGEANLYINNTSNNSYSAVFTWGVVAGFQEMKDDDISIRNLRDYDPIIGMYNNSDNDWVQEAKDWSNDEYVVHPYRAYTELDSESEFKCHARADGDEPISLATIPAVPVKKIIDEINRHYGLKFNLGGIYKGTSIWNGTHYVDTDDDRVISRGVVPLVKVGLTSSQLKSRTAILKNLTLKGFTLFLKNGQTYPLAGWEDFKMENIISFDIVTSPQYAYFDIGKGGNLRDEIKWVFHVKDSVGRKVYRVEKFALDGYVKVTFLNAGGWSIKKNGYMHEDYTDKIPKLIVYRKGYEVDKDKSDGVRTVLKDVYEEAGSVSGRNRAYAGQAKIGDITYVLYTWEFDFRKAEGFSQIEITDNMGDYMGTSNSTSPYFFGFDAYAYAIVDQKPISIIPQGEVSTDVIKGRETDIFSNLPDISCMDFMKSLFYIIGATPISNANGEIIPMCYDSLRLNIERGKVLDWSNKIMTSPSSLPEKIDFKLSGTAQRNYYLLKNDELDEMTSADEDNDDDIYESGMMCLQCDDQTLDKDKTIIQVPWYGAWLKNGKAPNYNTCRDMKYSEYDVDKDESKSCEAKPAIGLIVPAKEGKYQQSGTDSNGYPTYDIVPTGKYRTYMEIYNPFKSLSVNRNYNYLQNIIIRPVVITETLNLNEFDLRDIDYSVPVYLNKYNSYFAVVSIKRDSKGKCKCELIKLP